MSASTSSTLPGVKDLFPEHLFDNLSRAVVPPQPSTFLSRPAQLDRYPLAQSPQDSNHQLWNNTRSPKRSYENMMHSRLPSNGGSSSVSDSQPPQQLARIDSTVQFVHAVVDTSGREQDFQVHSTRTRNGLGNPSKGDSDFSEGANKLRHVCGECGKRFNRPSSLRIHANTHTGAKPHICPFPGCGRAFSVSSNMRRHHRGHARQMHSAVLPGTVSPYQATDTTSAGDTEHDVREFATYTTTTMSADARDYNIASPSRDVHRHYMPLRSSGPPTYDDFSVPSPSHSRTSSFDNSNNAMVRRHYPPTPPYSVGSPASQMGDIIDDVPHAYTQAGPKTEKPHEREKSGPTHKRHPRGSLSDILIPVEDCGRPGVDVSPIEIDHPIADRPNLTSASETQRRSGTRQQPSPDTPSVACSYRSLC